MASEPPDQAALSISTDTESDGVPVVSVAGEIDISNSEALLEAISVALVVHPPRLILDLRGVTFMDSSGINVLVRSATTGTALYLRDPSPLVRRVIELTGLTDVLQILS
jgi:anti-anti-sigma factor